MDSSTAPFRGTEHQWFISTDAVRMRAEQEEQLQLDCPYSLSNMFNTQDILPSLHPPLFIVEFRDVVSDACCNPWTDYSGNREIMYLSKASIWARIWRTAY